MLTNRAESFFHIGGNTKQSHGVTAHGLETGVKHSIKYSVVWQDISSRVVASIVNRSQRGTAGPVTIIHNIAFATILAPTLPCGTVHATSRSIQQGYSARLTRPLFRTTMWQRWGNKQPAISHPTTFTHLDRDDGYYYDDDGYLETIPEVDSISSRRQSAQIERLPELPL